MAHRVCDQFFYWKQGDRMLPCQRVFGHRGHCGYSLTPTPPARPVSVLGRPLPTADLVAVKEH